MTVKENGSIWIVLRSRRSLMAPGIAMTVREGLRKKNRNNHLGLRVGMRGVNKSLGKCDCCSGDPGF
jgi:hypothetical protein